MTKVSVLFGDDRNLCERDSPPASSCLPPIAIDFDEIYVLETQ